MFDFLKDYIDLLINVSLILGLGSIFIILPYKNRNTSLKVQITTGVLISLIGILIMNAQFYIVEGFLLDTRSILLSVSSAFFGLVPGVIVAVFLSIFRLYQGGAGALTGVVVIFVTMAAGLVFRRYRLKKLSLKKVSSYLELYAFGFVTHLLMLLCFFTLPIDTALNVLGLIFWPVMILFPITTIPIGVIMMKQRSNVENQDKIEYLSEHDYLTGLFNRHYLEKTIKAYDNDEFYPLCLVMGDLNGLKLVNDTYGHLKGDELLKLVSKILSDSIGEKSVVARWGGDEFIMILPNSGITKGGELISTIKKKCSGNKLDEIEPSISLGCAVKSDSNENMDDILSLAEEMMYRNKLSDSQSFRSHFIHILERTLQEREYESENHSKNLINYSLQIGEKLELPISYYSDIKLVARLHDIGKIGISEKILLKPDRLTKEEYEEVKKHSIIGYRILDSIVDLKHISKYVLHHHERYDGSGYPGKLKGEDIPLISRIITIADSYDVMISGRVYQAAKTKEEAIEDLRQNSGAQFDPKLVEIFIKILNESE